MPDDADRARVRRPHCERSSGDAVDLPDARAELLVQVLVPALRGQVDVELAERRQEGVRVGDLDAEAVGIRDREPVMGRQRLGRHLAGEHARGMHLLQLGVTTALEQDTNLRRVRPEGADDDGLPSWMRAEKVVRVRVIPP
jgi:hypothetical protein